MSRWLAVALVAAASPVAAQESGVASIYRDQRVSCPGETYNPHAMIAAHKTLPCGSVVEVKNKKNGKTVTVEIVDRGPFKPGRVIDLTPAGAIRAGFSEMQGLAEVTIRTVLGFRDRWRGETRTPSEAQHFAKPVKTTVIKP